MKKNPSVGFGLPPKQEKFWQNRSENLEKIDRKNRKKMVEYGEECASDAYKTTHTKNTLKTHIRSFMLRIVWPYSNPCSRL